VISLSTTSTIIDLLCSILNSIMDAETLVPWHGTIVLSTKVRENKISAISLACVPYKREASLLTGSFTVDGTRVPYVFRALRGSTAYIPGYLYLLE
jgi:hypothetical protein